MCYDGTYPNYASGTYFYTFINNHRITQPNMFSYVYVFSRIGPDVIFIINCMLITCSDSNPLRKYTIFTDSQICSFTAYKRNILIKCYMCIQLYMIMITRYKYCIVFLEYTIICYLQSVIISPNDNVKFTKYTRWINIDGITLTRDILDNFMLIKK